MAEPDTPLVRSRPRISTDMACRYTLVDDARQETGRAVARAMAVLGASLGGFANAIMPDPGDLAYGSAWGSKSTSTELPRCRC